MFAGRILGKPCRSFYFSYNTRAIQYKCSTHAPSFVPAAISILLQSLVDIVTKANQRPWMWVSSDVSAKGTQSAPGGGGGLNTFIVGVAATPSDGSHRRNLRRWGRRSQVTATCCRTAGSSGAACRCLRFSTRSKPVKHSKQDRYCLTSDNLLSTVNKTVIISAVKHN